MGDLQPSAASRTLKKPALEQALVLLVLLAGIELATY
jgi:hypothetical protein